MTVSGYLRIFRERWRLIATVTVLSFLIALGITVATPKQYQASAQVFVASNTTNDPAAQYEAAAFLQSQVSTFAAIVTSPEILHKVESDLNLGLSDQELKAKLSADAPAAQSLVNIHATDGNADQAAALANSTAKAFITAIEGYLTTLGTNAPSVRLYVTDPATAPSSPISPQTLLNLSLGIFLGLLLGAALAVARDLLDNRIKTVGRVGEGLWRAADGRDRRGLQDRPDSDRHPGQRTQPACGELPAVAGESPVRQR